MLHRLSPLALVMVAACERAPDYSGCRLVGTWEVRLPLEGQFAVRGAKEELIGTETFTASGQRITTGFATTCSLSASADPVREDGVMVPEGSAQLSPYESSWMLESESSDRVAVVLPVPDVPGRTLRRIYLVKSADELVPDGDGAKSRLVRVPGPK